MHEIRNVKIRNSRKNICTKTQFVKLQGECELSWIKKLKTAYPLKT
jgi:hypothetical protein